jgi:hypothetical protein
MGPQGVKVFEAPLPPVQGVVWMQHLSLDAFLQVHISKAYRLQIH